VVRSVAQRGKQSQNLVRENPRGGGKGSPRRGKPSYERDAKHKSGLGLESVSIAGENRGRRASTAPAGHAVPTAPSREVP